ncbi:hypothetical protein B0H10DRAFT_1949179 [Mycena sp. CBHHK59/15]|nr:hypothetical protein B0H10DRAFT_1949179 [Mycena sp. CBHHK59/15]
MYIEWYIDDIQTEIYGNMIWGMVPCPTSSAPTQHATATQVTHHTVITNTWTDTILQGGAEGIQWWNGPGFGEHIETALLGGDVSFGRGHRRQYRVTQHGEDATDGSIMRCRAEQENSHRQPDCDTMQKKHDGGEKSERMQRREAGREVEGGGRERRREQPTVAIKSGHSCARAWSI